VYTFPDSVNSSPNVPPAATEAIVSVSEIGCGISIGSKIYFNMEWFNDSDISPDYPLPRHLPHCRQFQKATEASSSTAQTYPIDLLIDHALPILRVSPYP
jgi:hypothetical protein